jgi:hypothetical protein
LELLLGEDDVWTRHTRITGKKGHNFLSDCWIMLKFLQEFLEGFVLVVSMKSLLGEEEVWTRRPE